ncbi:class I SAM-dependent methyltransferase [Streptomyces afghaniensis]|uniref:class I SAM-dependent methyltransferase n=1 Tax=Streptomyces afghaniensis TaxID=66865 RepID=UPI00278A3835|nr:class I SAM-dependent methyltransferase [Streptomyces afghaniensis]MDQ1016515.1 O-methyltransferase/aklanonic acid methyltransferase [Streptomyces afghaniensis]
MDTAAYKTKVTDAFNGAAATYDRLGVEFFTPMGRRLVERSAPRPGERVLDIGCGRGATLLPAAGLIGPAGRALGIDIAPAMIDEARREAARQGITNVELRVMDGEHPDLPAASFDLVLGSYSVIFLPQARAALARYAGLLADGGRIGFTSPVFTRDTFPFLPPMFTELIPLSLLRHLPESWHPEQLHRQLHSWLEHPADLSAAMEQAGFTDVEIVDEPVAMSAVSGAAWVDWSHTQGMRLLWQHLPDDEAAALRSRLIGALDALRDGDGPVLIEVPVRYVTARVAR